MSDTWRCFVAVPIPESLRGALATVVAAVRDDPAVADLRWSDPASWHLTLAFLGAVASDDVERITAAVRDVAAATQAFAVDTGGLGAFPSAREARVVWYGVDDRGGQLGALATRSHEALGLEPPRRFRAHLTLARSRQRFRGPDLMEWLTSTHSPRGQIPVNRLILFRSHLGSGPARYEALAEAPLPSLVSSA